MSREYNYTEEFKVQISKLRESGKLISAIVKEHGIAKSTNCKHRKENPMAVDPITGKILAQLAAQVVTDEQARKRLLSIILCPVIFLLLIIALILYLITSPFSALSGWLIGDELAVVNLSPKV